MNQYCTYFDRGFLIQGLALWRSLQRHDPVAVLWVLALDEATVGIVQRLGDPRLHVVPLGEIERGDTELENAGRNRSRVEYYFTLSPCWPRWLLRHHPEFDRITYLDADLFFYGAPGEIFDTMDKAGASILITSHRFPSWLAHYERHGQYNVGLLSFRRDAAGMACLDDWRDRCIAWCYDRVEPQRYADQKYLDAWPGRWPREVLVLDHPGVNLAPWNWPRCRLDSTTPPRVDGVPVVVFHFARFRPQGGDRWWRAGQLDYGVMPGRWRNALYVPYIRALFDARQELRRIDATLDFPRRPERLDRTFWRGLPMRALFGGDWLRIGGRLFNLRFGLGRWSGWTLAVLRRRLRPART